MSPELNPLWLGMDCGEQWHVLVELTTEGMWQRARKLRNREADLRAWLSEVVRSGNGRPLRVVVEGVRSVGSVLSRVALEMGIEIWQVAPQALKDYRSAEGQPRKDDSWDGYLLARMGYQKMRTCRPALCPRPEERRLCRLSRLKQQLTGQHTRLLNQLRSRLLELSGELVAGAWEGPRWDSMRLRAALRRWPGLEGLGEAPVEEVAQVLRRAGRTPDSHEEAEALHRVVLGIHLPETERSIITLELRIVVQQLDSLEQAQK